MEDSFSALFGSLTGFWTSLLVQAKLLLLPSRLTQLAILAGCALVAWLFRRWLAPRFTDGLHSLESRPKWQLRSLLVIRNRLWLIFFVLIV